MQSSPVAQPVADTNGMPLDIAKIKTLREAIPLTQEQAARRAGFSSRQKWNDIENGRRMNLSIETLEKIAGVLGVKARDLLK
jgi:transcriptional regulator with XRE-family HTH domain